jgi:hypothetical protein
MQTTQPIHLSTLPPQAQIELYDFYLFLQQRYANKKPQIIQTKPTFKPEQFFGISHLKNTEQLLKDMRNEWE